jgi:hydrogenase maturation protease
VRLVIGYGNPLRADDGLGWIVAQQLRRDLTYHRVPADVVVLAEHQLTPELAEPIGRARLVVFVDARQGNRPGHIACRAVVPAGDGPRAFSHEVDPPSLVALARLLYGACPTAVMVSVDGDDFGYGLALSPVVQAAVRPVVERVRDILANGVAALSTPVLAGPGCRSIGGE